MPNKKNTNRWSFLVDANGRARTTRRSGAEAGVSLRKRRIWFDDQSDQDGGQDAPEGNNQQDNQQFDVAGLPPAAQAYIQGLTTQVAALNQESAGRRLALKEAQDTLTALKTAQQAQMEQDGNFKSLYEQAQADIAALTPHKERSEQLEQTIRASNEADVERIPDDMKGLVPTELSAIKLRAWLDGNIQLLTKKPAPDTDAGAGSGQGTTTSLTDEEKMFAAKAGMTAKDFAAGKAKMAKPE